MECRYIVYTGEDYESFDDLKEAENYANECIENCLTADGWYEEVESIFVAQVIIRTEMYGKKERKDLDDEITNSWPKEWPYTCKYRLAKVKGTS